jgi:hypothetical protein
VCLLALKHLVSLLARVRPSVQAELDLHTAEKRPGRETEGEKSSWVPWQSGVAIRLGETSSVGEDPE